MTDEQRAAYIQAQTVSALAEIEGMKAANKYREMRGETIAYNEDSFYAVVDKYGISHNAICSFFSAPY